MSTSKNDLNGPGILGGCHYNADSDGKQITFLETMSRSLSNIEKQHSDLVTRLLDRMDNKDSIPLKSHYLILFSMACGFGIASYLLQLVGKH